ncbi:MAG: prepilin peptidase, partial [Victivallales bacterium]|nr:prepilin peptidase [Victivallales bacterium]
MTTSLAILLALAPALAVLCYTDCKLRRLPNAITIPLAAAALVWRLGYGGVELALLGLGGGLVCFLFLLIPVLMKGVGGGDLKMFFAVGCAIGLKRVAGFL